MGRSPSRRVVHECDLHLSLLHPEHLDSLSTCRLRLLCSLRCPRRTHSLSRSRSLRRHERVKASRPTLHCFRSFRIRQRKVQISCVSTLNSRTHKMQMARCHYRRESERSFFDRRNSKTKSHHKRPQTRAQQQSRSLPGGAWADSSLLAEAFLRVLKWIRRGT